jgi:hypothetical protein
MKTSALLNPARPAIHDFSQQPVSNPLVRKGYHAKTIIVPRLVGAGDVEELTTRNTLDILIEIP